MKPIRYHRLALREYEAESRYYRTQKLGLEIDFQQEIKAAEERIERHHNCSPTLERRGVADAR